MAVLFSRRSVVHVALVAVLASMLVWIQPSVAVMAPSTLADQKPVQAGPVETDFPIDYVGVLYDAPGAHGHDNEHGHAASQAAVRLRHDGVWGTWMPLQEDGAQAEDRWTSALVSAAGATAYQVRGVPAAALDAKAVAINTTDGPLEKVGERPGGAADALSTADCVTRAEWGADESWRTTGRNKRYTPEYQDVQALTVHHTVTANDDPDPAGTVRAIYRWHAVDTGGATSATST
ncbi:hypothetical protein [Ornithinimicrobium sp. W1665]|uniref:hypothetical protein n=1 Tax=Ornithinimicrobium sp. W1665 TaxID=3416666 RepID=UPI003D6C1567